MKHLLNICNINGAEVEPAAFSRRFSEKHHTNQFKEE